MVRLSEIFCFKIIVVFFFKFNFIFVFFIVVLERSKGMFELIIFVLIIIGLLIKYMGSLYFFLDFNFVLFLNLKILCFLCFIIFLCLFFFSEFR